MKWTQTRHQQVHKGPRPPQLPCSASLARSSSCSFWASCTRSSVAESTSAEQPPWLSSRSLLSMSFICRSRLTSSCSWATSSRSRTATTKRVLSEPASMSALRVAHQTWAWPSDPAHVPSVKWCSSNVKDVVRRKAERKQLANRVSLHRGVLQWTRFEEQLEQRRAERARNSRLKRRLAISEWLYLPGIVVGILQNTSLFFKRPKKADSSSWVLIRAKWISSLQRRGGNVLHFLLLIRVGKKPVPWF